MAKQKEKEKAGAKRGRTSEKPQLDLFGPERPRPPRRPPQRTEGREHSGAAAAAGRGRAHPRASAPRGERGGEGATGDGRVDGREAARDLRLRVLRQEPPPARLRQPAQGAAHHRQGGRRQLARRLRGGRHPARDSRSTIAASVGRGPLPRRRAGQRPGHRQGADPEDLRQAALRLEVPPPAQSRGQQGIGISAAGMYGLLTTGKPVAIISSRGRKRKPAHYFEIQIDTRKNEPSRDSRARRSPSGTQEHGTRVEIELAANWQTAASAPSTATSSRRRSPTRTPRSTTRPSRGPARERHRPGNETLPSRAPRRAAAGAGRDQAAPVRRRAGRADEAARGVQEPHVRGFLQTASAASRPRVAGEIWPRCPGASSPSGRARSARTGDGRGAVQGDPADEDHGPADELPGPIGEELIRKGLVSFLSVIESEVYAGDENAQLDLDSAGISRRAWPA